MLVVEIFFTDFSISCIGSLEIMERTIGTPFYMAPEMENQDYGSSVDIWAIGVALYKLMYNQL